MANEHLATTPAEIADLDQWINEFRGMTSSARIGVTGKQRQIETALLLAPRYNRAVAGWLWSMGRGGIRGAKARSSLVKGIVAITIMGFLISLIRWNFLISQIIKLNY